MKNILLVGNKFNRWTFLGKGVVVKNNNKYSIFKCDCGTIKQLKISSVLLGETKSCGCLQKEITSNRVKTHGMSGSPEYRAWCKMKSRCLNKKDKRYYEYGGRGIFVCDRWAHSFINFLEDMGKRPSCLHSLDRIGNNDGYYKENCRWALESVQKQNMRSNIWVEYDGLKMILSDWAKYFNVDSSHFYKMNKKYSFDYIYNFYTSKKNKQNNK